MSTLSAPAHALPFGASRISRDQLPAGRSLCEFCTAKCCHYFALPIDPPTTSEEFDFIRWYLLHDRATVFTEDGDWYLLVHTTCKHLLPDNRCGIYETRPQICRDYSTDNCEYDDEWTYERYLETPEQVEEYREAVLQKKGQSIRSPKPPLLPVLAGPAG
jgi:Fe-S-cluster containining protein